MNDLPAAPPTPEPPPRRAIPANASKWMIPIATFIVGLLIGFGAGAGGGGEDTPRPEPIGGDGESVSQTPSPEPDETSPTVSPSPPPPPSPEALSLTKQDVHLSLKTTEKQCFGSAGCNVSVQVRLAMDEAVADALPPDGTWDVTYEISGDESGPLIGTFSLYGDGKYDVNEESISTRSSNTPVRVKVIDVERFS
jgi:hypothetical protein